FFVSAEEFEKLIARFQKKTDALVIDQLNNPGGLVINMYGLCTYLTDRPIAIPTERLTITQDDVEAAYIMSTIFSEIESDQEARYALGDNLFGYPVDLEFIQGIVSSSELILQEWKEKNYFTKPMYILGIEYIKPHPKVRYTKPILFLVNQLDFSCADFLP